MATATDSVASVTRGAFPAQLKVGLIEKEVSFVTESAELAAQGDGVLATGDVIQVFSLPAGTLILAAGMEVTELVAGATQLVCDLGTGDDADQFVDGSDAGSPCDIGSSGSQAAVGTYSDLADSITTTTAGKSKVLSSADTLDITAQAMTGAITAGKVRVWALIADIDGTSV